MVREVVGEPECHHRSQGRVSNVATMPNVAERNNIRTKNDLWEAV